MRADGLDLRERIVAARLAGEASAAVARWFGVSGRTVERYVRRRQAAGELRPRPRPGRPRLLTTEQVW